MYIIWLHGEIIISAQKEIIADFLYLINKLGYNFLGLMQFRGDQITIW